MHINGPTVRIQKTWEGSFSELIAVYALGIYEARKAGIITERVHPWLYGSGEIPNGWAGIPPPALSWGLRSPS